MDEPATKARLDRRPIAARKFRIFHTLASTLASWRISANAISVVGLLCGCIAGAAMLLNDGADVGDRLLYIATALLIQLRLLANLLDGMVAVECGLKSPTGQVFNEVPDRISDVIVLVCAGYMPASSPTLGWLAAMCALFTAYVRVFGCSVGLAGDYRGPMAKQQRMFLITVACIVIAAFPTWRLPSFQGEAEVGEVGGEVGGRGPMSVVLVLIVAGCVVTAVRRLARIITTLNASSPAR